MTAGAETLVQTMRAGRRSCLLVSGGFLSFANPIARGGRVRPGRANRLVFVGGQAQRGGRRPDRRCMSKQEALIETREQLGLKREDVLAVGDGANDK